jgi:probable F420-dependent oxidoreductase
MKIALFEMNTHPCVAPEAIATVARAAEDAGIESLWGGEHLILPDPAVRFPPDRVFVDLIATVAFAAAHTRQLRFGTGIILLPQRNPLVLAKEIASIDVLSGGRLILGLGIGSIEQEYKALGIPYEGRGRRAEEALAAMKAVWTMEKPEYRGEYFSFSGIRAEPRPVQKPFPEIVWGGRTPHAFSRAARLGKGWYGYDLTLEETANLIAGLRKACERHRRPFEELEISVTPKAEPKLDRDLARRFADLGVGRLIIAPRARDVDGVLQVIARASRDLIGKIN